MKVKICGITDEQTAIAVKQSGADAIGLVFAKSKRQLSPAQAAEISKSLNGIVKIGVFVNEELATIEQIAAEASLDIIQLHGEEPAEFARSLKLPVMKAFSYKQSISMHEVLAYPADYLLIDSPAGAYRGGNGTVFNWSELGRQKFDRSRLILAGGLTVENVEEAIGMVDPFGVDVSSGVETNGKKDVSKINSFIQRAKGAKK